MAYIDPEEGGAITAAVDWAQDHRFVSELRNPGCTGCGGGEARADV
jgi:hypothetical protein